MQRLRPDPPRPVERGRRSPGFAAVAGLAALLALAALTGCSLISLKTPERPLSDRDMNARLLTRELTTHFLELSARSADNILATETDPAVIEHTLRWELGVIESSRQAEMQLAPLMSLLDTWTLALQLRAFVSEGGRGGKLFGTHQAALREITDNYADGAQRLAHSLLSPKELADYQGFVASYVQAHPLVDLRFTRAPVLTEWTREKGAQSDLLGAVGTIPQALADTSQRLEIYGDTVPHQAVRRAQLGMRESGYEPSDLRAALARLDAHIDRLSSVAENAPELVRGAAAELRASLREVFDRLDASTRATAAALHAERVALFADIVEQREALLAAADVQRKALTADASRLADQVVRSSGAEVRHITREALLFVIVLAVVLLGLPFAAGYFAGRARATLRVG
jgi:hypothetical protein